MRDSHTSPLLGLSKWLLSPILLSQGIYVRRTVVKLQEAAGPRQGSCGTGQPLRLLILGDSAAAGVGTEQQTSALSGQLAGQLAAHYQLSWQLIARTGESSQTVQSLLHQHAQDNYDVALISIGVNDVTSTIAPQAFIQRCRQLTESLRQGFGVSTIIFSGLPPMGHFPALPHPLRWYLGSRASLFDRYLQDFCQQHHCLHLPFDLPIEADLIAKDGFHPGPKTYAIWAQRAANVIHTAKNQRGQSNLKH